MVEQTGDGIHAAETGQPLTAGDWLDAHFECCRPEYERALDMAGLQPGWRVLDAGCGGGSFLPLIADRVGPTGGVAAVDIAADNVDLARRRLAATGFRGGADIREGSLFELPFADGTFDAVWVANVLMYFPVERWDRALAECRRVTRPGGRVAVKEADGSIGNFWPCDDTNLQALKGMIWALTFPGYYETRRLPFALERAGLRVVRRETVLMERWAPLSPTDRAFLAQLIAWMAADARRVEPDLAPSVVDFWAQQADPDSREALINHPECSWLNGHLVVVGQAPG